MAAAGATQSVLHFRSVNRKSSPGYRDDWQRHHLIPRQFAFDRRTRGLFGKLYGVGFRLDDFATNGVLLPATIHAAQDTRLPVHAGPHRDYNEQVFDRITGLAPEAETGSKATLSAVQQMQASLRAALMTPRPDSLIAINAIDLSATSGAWLLLDEQVDELLAARIGRDAFNSASLPETTLWRSQT